MRDDSRPAALAAYRRFFDGFNSRDARSWAAALHFPHVRVSSRGPVTVVPSAEQHVAAMSWNAVEATGWDRSVEREPEIVHAGARCAHIAGGWTRYTKDNEPILSTFVTYVLTSVEGTWGVQARFAVDPGPSGLTSEHAETAVAVVRRYLDCWNAGRFAEAAKGLNYPAVQVHPGQLVVWRSEAEHAAWLAGRPRREVGITGARVVQAGPTAVNLSLRLSDDGREVDTLVLVTLRDGHWGFQAESTIE